MSVQREGTVQEVKAAESCKEGEREVLDVKVFPEEAWRSRRRPGLAQQTGLSVR